MIVDGSINWPDGTPHPAADNFDLPARKESLYLWVRQVRGGILAGACTVEQHISAAITLYTLGDRVRISQVREVFEESLLNTLTFERRINLILDIAPNLLPDAEVATLKAGLNELRSLRNAMAHRPFWLHPHINKDGRVTSLIPMIMHGKAPLPLTSALIDRLNVQIRSLVAQTNGLSTMLAEKLTSIKPEAP